jgi:hypothetical protein
MLRYLKIIGIVQKIDDNFYYSDVNKLTVGEVRPLTKQQIDEDFETASIDEGSIIRNVY